MGKRESEQQQDPFIAHDNLPRSPSQAFYDKLNRLLGEGGLDTHVETLCDPYYADGKGRRSVPTDVYLRMLLVGYFKGINSQRGIARQCSDSLSLRTFLGIAMGENSPDHSPPSTIRNRLPLGTLYNTVIRRTYRKTRRSLYSSRRNGRRRRGLDIHLLWAAPV